MRTGRVILFTLLLSAVLSAQDPLSAVRANMEKLRTFQADFIQRKKIASMNHTMTIEGEIALDKSGRMAWRVLKPIRYVCLISGDSLTQWDADSDRTIRLDTAKNPALKVLLQSMTDYFSGNFKRMEKDFQITSPSPDTIRLVPHSGSMTARFIRKLEFQFSPDASCIAQVYIFENSGDATEIEYRNIRINQPIPETTWKAGKR